MNKKLIIRISLGVIAFIVIFSIIGKRKGWIGEEPGIKVSVEEAILRDIVEIVNANGKIQPVTEVKISPDVSGEIIQLPVVEGMQVKKGDLLARINPDIYISTVDRLEASLNTSRANLANTRARESQAQAQFINAETSFKRNEQLHRQNAISDAELDAARAQYLVAKSEMEAARQSVVGAEFQVKSAEAMVKEGRESLAKTSIFAPIDGTISRLDVELGERVVGTSQFAGTEIMRIANLAEMEVKVEVNENDIVRVNMGDTAIVEIDAFLGEKFKAVVTSIANSAKSAVASLDQVTNFEVRIRLLPVSYEHLMANRPPEVSPFRPGMSANVDIQTKKAAQVLSIPIQSVTTREDTSSVGTSRRTAKKEEKTEDAELQPETESTTQAPKGLPQEYVFVVVDGKARLRAVKTGIQDNTNIQITEGLQTGEKVIAGPYRAVSRTLKNGNKVIIVDKEKLFSEN